MTISERYPDALVVFYPPTRFERRGSWYYCHEHGFKGRGRESLIVHIYKEDKPWAYYPTPERLVRNLGRSTW